MQLPEQRFAVLNTGRGQMVLHASPPAFGAHVGAAVAEKAAGAVELEARLPRAAQQRRRGGRRFTLECQWESWYWCFEVPFACPFECSIASLIPPARKWQVVFAGAGDREESADETAGLAPLSSQTARPLLMIFFDSRSRLRSHTRTGSRPRCGSKPGRRAASS